MTISLGFLPNALQWCTQSGKAFLSMVFSITKLAETSYRDHERIVASPHSAVPLVKLPGPA
jgi:hypothetical protein